MKITQILLLSVMAIALNNNAVLASDPSLTEVWEPVPSIVTPGSVSSAPSDAVVLFDGKHLDEWEKPNKSPANWSTQGGVLTVVPGEGFIQTKRTFGDMQLHIEWRSPVEKNRKGQDKGNSGIFIQGRYELQVLNSYNNKTYSNGQAASIYKQYSPLVNAMRPTGQWQTYDVIYRAPRFNQNGSLKQPAYITVLHNGVLVQNHVALNGGTVYSGKPVYSAHGDAPIALQDHSNPVSYRNIWVRAL